MCCSSMSAMHWPAVHVGSTVTRLPVITSPIVVSLEILPFSTTFRA